MAPPRKRNSATPIPRKRASSAPKSEPKKQGFPEELKMVKRRDRYRYLEEPEVQFASSIPLTLDTEVAVYKLDRICKVKLDCGDESK